MGHILINFTYIFLKVLLMPHCVHWRSLHIALEEKGREEAGAPWGAECTDPMMETSALAMSSHIVHSDLLQGTGFLESKSTWVSSGEGH